MESWPNISELDSTKRTIKFFEGLLRSTPNGIVVTDAAQNIVLVNEIFSSYFQCHWRDIIETNLFVWLERLHGNAPGHWVKLIETVYHDMYCNDVNFEMLTKDGIRYFCVNASLIEQDVTEKEGVIVSLWRDITRQKQMEEKIISSERLSVLGKVSGSIAHEIKNPLGVIDSSVYYLKMMLKNADDKIITHLDRIKEQVIKASEIIQSLFNIAKMKEPQKAKVNIIDILDSVLATIEIPQTINVIKEDMTMEYIVDADAEQLAIVFQNIIINAVHAMKEYGVLSVRIKILKEKTPGTQFVEIEVHDTGHGISIENRERIFEPLFSTKVNGIGFGLTICKMIIERHGGSITVDSEKGKGTTFYISLPLVKSNTGITNNLARKN